MIVLALVALAFALVPALMFLANLRRYRPAPTSTVIRSVSVLIPARNEERSIGPAVEAALASNGVEMEVIVLDDHSDDDTPAIVKELAARDGRVRLEISPPLPEGWCGKQHACHVLAGHARFDLLLFVDADVRLRSDGVARLAEFLETSGADLVSGVPHQETGTIFEKLLIPLIHYLLLGFLPLDRMRSSRHPAYSAGCGQLFLARKDAYHRAGGHSAIRSSRHDGIALPRAFREAGLKTDLVDATDLATCRMYRGAREVWHGLSKNATEGMAKPRLIVPCTLMLMSGSVLPLVACAWFWDDPVALLLSGAASALMWLPRLLGAVHFRQSMTGAMLHPVGILVLLAIQWAALGRSLLGVAPTWKGRRLA